MAENKNTLKVLVTTFVVLIFALAFIVSIADQTNTVTTKSTVTGETYDLSTSCYTGDDQVNESNSACNYTVTYAPTSWKQEDCPLTSVVVTNNTGTALVLDTDYSVFASTGVVQFLNTTDTEASALGNNAKVDYAYCGDGYLNSSWGRSVLGTNTGLFAIAILIAVLIAVYLLFNRKDDD